MGLFREAGRQIEQFKQSVAESAEEAEPDDAEGSDGDADYECESCGARFDADEEECPECWSSEITRLAE